MKLALLGRHISHSLSPRLYNQFLGSELISYDLIDCEEEKDIPTLAELSKKLDGLNITSPYKRLFTDKVEVTSDVARRIGAINTISFGKTVKGTNTDALAVEIILKEYLISYPHLNVIVLGGGVMSEMTKLILDKLNCPSQIITRASHGDLTHLNLQDFYLPQFKTLVINSCSRSFEFKGLLHPEFLVWDYNYNFSPHELSMKPQVESYEDGKRMLELQAQEAIKFWKQNKD